MDIQNIDLRRGDFEGMHPKAKLFGFDEDKKLYTGDGVESINDQWTTWCACIGMLCLDGKKAQAVPDLGELQERIAGHQYYHDEHGHMIVDMDDVVKEISGFDSWKAQAVPDTYTPIVLALEDVQSKIAQASFLTMDADNENEVYAVDANELHEYIAELIEAQDPAND
ncbi:hypothetical protein KTJ53_12605 [Acinetobacter variabilis]|uniref:hypothetical protein n=1 Tax=Acinetobacter variabilis TaxID=70346 RepID=UPI0021CDED49|nr:hypothetical protein [Acinetobacter variabilis]MCU4630513.1 hypothetical protein [Acinetobacter variabilis]